MEETEVVIIGGGPSGLALSLALSHQHIKNIILEMNEEICEDPRAIAIAGDTCRILRLCGVSDDAFTRIGQGWSNRVVLSRRRVITKLTLLLIQPYLILISIMANLQTDLFSALTSEETG